MDGEGALADANVEQAIYWRQIYHHILQMEENVLARIRELMAKRSVQARREVELTNVPVVDFNNSVHWDIGRRAQNMANVIAAMDDRRLVSAYHAFTSESHGAESQPTIYWRDRKLDGPRFHIDFCFIPSEWVPSLEAVEVGGFAEYVGQGLSDHVPLVVNLAAITSRPLT